MIRKQLKITKLFRKGAKKLPDDCDEIEEEIQQLEQRLREKQNELFQIQRNQYRRKISTPNESSDSFVKPQKIVVSNSVEGLRRKLEVISMLTGTEVQSYVAGDHCCVVFHMQHDSHHEVKYGIRIDMKSGENDVSACSLPIGFNLNAVLEDFDNLMNPDCLASVRRALVAYHDRLEQFDALKKLVNIEADLFRAQDGSHVQISMFVQSVSGAGVRGGWGGGECDEEDDEQFNVVVMLDYKVYDIRAKNYAVKEYGLPDEGIAEALRAQCAVFKKKPLHLAFKEAFLDGVGPYRMVQQVGVRRNPKSPPRRKKRFRPNKHHYNDDTFLPEDCSDQGEDDDYVD